MIRANLLPRPNDRVRLFGIVFSMDVVRACAFGLLTIAFVAGVGRTLSWYRALELETRARADDAQLTRNAAERLRLRELASRVATLRAIDRDAIAAQRSGNDAALAIARIGNAVPADVWLDELTQTGEDVHMSGRSTSLGRVGLAVASLGRAVPGRDARLLGVEGQDRRALHFSVQLKSTVRQ